jgi:hypothetical protein
MIEAAETRLRDMCSREKLRDSNTIAATWQIIIETIPQRTIDSAKPPALAASPVAFVFDTPRNA